MLAHPMLRSMYDESPGGLASRPKGRDMVPRKKRNDARREDDDREPPTLRSPTPLFEDEEYDEDRPTPLYGMTEERGSVPIRAPR